MPGGIHAPIDAVSSWPRPNYDNPTRRPDTIFLIACICGPIAFCMLLVRLWVRIFYQRSPGWDDWLMLIATLPTIGLTVVFPLATRTVFDRHIWDIDLLADPDLIVIARKYVLVILTMFCSTSGIIKISILLFYRRLSDRVVSKKFQWATWFSIGFIAAYTVTMTIIPIIGCNPVSAFWDQLHPIKQVQGYTYYCFDEGADILAAGVFSAVQDFMTAILPTFLYWNIQIPTRKKIALLAIFAIGYGGVALASMRAYYTWRIYYATYDVTWETWNLFLVTILELHVGAFCANAPSLKVFFKHFCHENIKTKAKTPDSSGQMSGKKSYSLEPKTNESNNSALEEDAYLFSKDGSIHSKSGYIPEHCSGVSVDIHGGVQIEKEACVVNSPPLIVNTNTFPVRHGIRESADTASILCDYDYDDIELGRYTTGANSHKSSSLASPRTLEFFRTLKPQATVQSPTLRQLPTSPNSVLTFQTMGHDKSSPIIPSRFSNRSSSRLNPQWQTWI